MLEGWMIPAVLVKGFAIAALLMGVAEASFWQSLIVAVVSATITGGFLVLSNWINAKHSGKKVDELSDTVVPKVEEIKEKVNGRE